MFYRINTETNTLDCYRHRTAMNGQILPEIVDSVSLNGLGSITEIRDTFNAIY